MTSLDIIQAHINKCMHTHIHIHIHIHIHTSSDACKVFPHMQAIPILEHGR